MDPLSPSSIVFGRVMMWVAIAMAITAIGTGVWGYSEHMEKRIALSEQNATQSQLNDVTGQLVQNYEDYQRRLGEANQTKMLVTKQYITTIQNIERGGDKNETCDEAMRALDAAID